MMRVAERNGLLPGNIRLRSPRGSAPGAEEPQQKSHNEHKSEDAHLRECVCAAMEDLRHATAPLFPASFASYGLDPDKMYVRCIFSDANSLSLLRIPGFP